MRSITPFFTINWTVTGMTTLPLQYGKTKAADHNAQIIIHFGSYPILCWFFYPFFENHIGQIIVNQAGFVKKRGTADAVHTTRLFLEKNCEKHLYIAFLDTEKTFECVPFKSIWYALWQHARRTRAQD